MHCNILQYSATHCNTQAQGSHHPPSHTHTHTHAHVHTHTHTGGTSADNVCQGLAGGARVILQHIASHYSTLQHTATHCNILQHTATYRRHICAQCMPRPLRRRENHTATHCNTLQHTATHCSILQHTATHCNTL